jgi:hypothetical protein
MEKILKISRNICFYLTLDKDNVKLILKALRYLISDAIYTNGNNKERKEIDKIIREIERELKEK